MPIKSIIQERIRTAILGAVLGDALGVPYEFSSRKAMKKSPATGMIGHGTHDQTAGTWSDDSSLLLCTAESLTSGYDLDDMAQRFLRWFDEGYMTPHGETFDYGGITAEAMRSLRRGVPALEAGRSAETDNGNGSLMRILSVGLHFHGLSKAELLTRASEISSITHAHPRSRLACGIYCPLVADLLSADAASVGELRERLSRKIKTLGSELDQVLEEVAMRNELPHFSRLFSPDFASLPEEDIESGGYVLQTLETALWCVLDTDSFESAVLRAVNLGSDTDTTACVAGGLAGLIYGTAGLPASWLGGLQNQEMVLGVVDRFVSSMQKK